MTTTAPPFDQRLAAVAHPEWLALMVKVDTVAGPVPMDLWTHQREIIRAVLSGSRVIVLKARQLGVSWCLALIALWWALAHPGQTVLVVSIGDREAQSLMRKVRRLYDSLPEIVKRAYPLGADTASRVEVQHAEGPATILSLPSSSTAGRGETIHLLLGDERPAWPHADDQEASLFPAAADSGRIVLVGTANGMDTFYDRWMGAPDNTWHPIFVGALARPGRTAEWVERERASLGDTGPQELPLTPSEAFLASGRCAFGRERLGEMERYSCCPAEWRGHLERTEAGLVPTPDEQGDLWVWEWPIPGRKYLVPWDSSGGTATGDFTAGAVYDIGSREQVAAFHGRLEPTAGARALARLGWLYNRALVAPENNNHGQAVVALLKEWGYPNIYRHELFDQVTRKRTVTLGWTTNQKTRHQLVGALQAGVSDGTLGIKDRAAVAEMHRFIWRETPTGGRYEADEGAHDDRVMVHGIAAVTLDHSRVAQPPREPVRQPEQVLDPITGYPVG